MKHKVCFFNQSSVHYRKNIFVLMDKELGVDFYFGDSRKQGAIKELDVSCLKNFKGYFHNIGKGALYWQNGAIKLLWSDYTDLITTGTHYCLSAWLIILLAPLFHKKIYLWSHGAYGDEKGLKKILAKWKMNHVEASFLYGNYAKNVLRKWGGDESKLHVFYNSLDYDRQLEIRKNLYSSRIYKKHFENNNINLFFIGRMMPIKKLDMIINAMKLLQERNIEVNLTFIGDGQEKTKLISLVDEYGLNKQVWFYGSCYDEVKIAELIYNADICISPGDVGLTAIHSMVFGTPVISHNNFKKQMPEFEAIHEGKTGSFFTEGDITSLADCIQRWLSAEHDRKSIREKCYEIIDEYYNPHKQIDIVKKVIFK